MTTLRRRYLRLKLDLLFLFKDLFRQPGLPWHHRLRLRLCQLQEMQRLRRLPLPTRPSATKPISEQTSRR